MAGITFNEILPAAGIISAYGFRPWWETIRFYFLNALFAIGLMIYFISYNFSMVDCVPSAADVPELSIPRSRFINSVCLQEMDGMFRFAGRNVIIGCLILYSAYSWWEMVPKVKERFGTVRNMDESLAGRHYAKALLKERAAARILKLGSGTSKKGQSGVAPVIREDVFRQLFFHKNQTFSLFFLYILRNLVSAVVAGAGIWISLKFYQRSREESDGTFTCLLNDRIAAEVGASEFLCSNSLPSQLDLYFFAILCVLTVIEVITLSAFVASLKVMRSTNAARSLSRDGRILNQDYAFVLFFARHSSRGHDSTKKMLLLAEREFILNEAGDEWDFKEKGFGLDTIQTLLFLLLHVDGVAKVAKQIDSLKTGSSRENFHVSSCLGVDCPNQDFSDLFEILFSKKSFKSFFQLHDLLFAPNELTEPLKIDYEQCCCSITLTKKILKNEDFYQEVLNRSKDPSCGQKVIMHVFLQLLPKKDRSRFLKGHEEFGIFIKHLVEQNLADASLLQLAEGKENIASIPVRRFLGCPSPLMMWCCNTTQTEDPEEGNKKPKQSRAKPNCEKFGRSSEIDEKSRLVTEEETQNILSTSETKGGADSTALTSPADQCDVTMKSVVASTRANNDISSSDGTREVGAMQQTPVEVVTPTQIVADTPPSDERKKAGAMQQTPVLAQ